MLNDATKIAEMLKHVREETCEKRCMHYMLSLQYDLVKSASGFSSTIYNDFLNAYRNPLSAHESLYLGFLIGWYLEEMLPYSQHVVESATDLLIAKHPVNPLLFAFGRLHAVRQTFNIEFNDGFMHLDDFFANACKQLNLFSKNESVRWCLPVVYSWYREPVVFATIFPIEHINHSLAMVKMDPKNSGVHVGVLNQWFSFISEITHPKLTPEDVRFWYDTVKHKDLDWSWFIDSICQYAHGKYGPGESWQTGVALLPQITAIDVDAIM